MEPFQSPSAEGCAERSSFFRHVDFLGSLRVSLRQLAELSWHDFGTAVPQVRQAVMNRRNNRGWALVAFGAETGRPTIVCMNEDAIPAEPGPAWLVLARDTDVAQRPRTLPPPQAPETNASH